MARKRHGGMWGGALRHEYQTRGQGDGSPQRHAKETHQRPEDKRDGIRVSVSKTQTNPNCDANETSPFVRVEHKGKVVFIRRNWNPNK